MVLFALLWLDLHPRRARAKEVAESPVETTDVVAQSGKRERRGKRDRKGKRKPEDVAEPEGKPEAKVTPELTDTPEKPLEPRSRRARRAANKEGAK
jgi:hypothetical protein